MKGEEEGYDEGKVEGRSPTTRIFVGGLGESVTADDLQKTFSSLGIVNSVEIVRTNGRSFAYMDFHPSSDKSLSKLFSTYNGCMWKGSRLKIEKAKEHYLVRLQREWAEDAEHASEANNNNLDADKNTEPSKKSKELLNKQKMQLQIFIPRLKKVKSLPYIGTGKHKYSFQRVEVPPLPVYFCDCEEHCDPRENAKRRQISAPEPLGGEISKEELHLMNSVMNKFLEREDNAIAKAADCGARLFVEGDDHSSHSIGGVLFNESETDKAIDEDNIVMNIVIGGNMSLGLMRHHGTISSTQESRSRKRQASNNSPAQNKFKAQKVRSTETSNASKSTSREESYLYMAGESQREDFAFTKPVKKGSSENHCEELESIMEAGSTKSKPDIELSKGLSWVQKSSWRELVGEAGNSSFSISEILPVTPNYKGLPKSGCPDAMNSTGSKEQIFLKHNRGGSNGDSSQAFGVGKDDVPTDKDTESRSRKRQASNNRPAQNEFKAQKVKSTETSNASEPISRKESYLHTAGESQREEFASTKPVKKGSTENHCEELEGIMEAGSTESKPDVKLSRGLSWVHKSSWRELVGEAGNSSFSISEIVPVIPNYKGLPKSGCPDAMNFTGSKEQIFMKHNRGESNGDSSQAFGVGKGDVSTDKYAAPSGTNAVDIGKKEEILSNSEGEEKAIGNSSEIMEHDSNVIADPVVKKNYSAPKITSIGEAGIGEVCTFMRSVVSEREWMKTKAALSGSLKKKSNEK